MTAYWLDPALWPDRPMVMQHWVIIIRCPGCGSWVERGALPLHQELVHGI